MTGASVKDEKTATPDVSLKISVFPSPAWYIAFSSG